MSVYHVDEQHLMSVTSVKSDQQFNTGLTLDILIYQQIFELSYHEIVADDSIVLTTCWDVPSYRNIMSVDT